MERRKGNECGQTGGHRISCQTPFSNKGCAVSAESRAASQKNCCVSFLPPCFKQKMAGDFASPSTNNLELSILCKGPSPPCSKVFAHQ